MVLFLKDVSSVHGLTGIIGSLAIGFLASNKINPSVANGIIYDFDSGIELLGKQIAAVALTIVYAGV